MDTAPSTTQWILAHCGRYPALRPEDVLKALHQSVFGCGHLVTDEAAGLRMLREELSGPLPARAEPGPEPLDGGFCRLHLGDLSEIGLAPGTLFRLFALSAEAPAGDIPQLEEKLSCLLALARDGRLPFSLAETSRAVAAWREAGFPPCRHSQAFRRAYAPAYRLIRRQYADLLPLLCAIDRRMAAAAPVIVALEGGSAAGKTTLAALLRRIYGCSVFHMDDFFLRPEQRTEERLAEPGGNVDYERFYEEVLSPLRRGGTVLYRPYSCHTRTLSAPTKIAPGALSIVEGAYSMHPALSGCYDLSVFLRVSPEAQRARIRARNTPADQARFLSLWIPLEEAYFAATGAAGRCDLILEVTE